MIGQVMEKDNRAWNGKWHTKWIIGHKMDNQDVNLYRYIFLRVSFPYPLTFHFYWIFHCKCTFTIFTLFPYWLALFLGFLFGEHTQKLRYRMVCNETQITTLWIRFPFLRPDYLDCFVEKESLAVKISKALLKEQQVIRAQTPVSE